MSVKFIKYKYVALFSLFILPLFVNSQDSAHAQSSNKEYANRLLNDRVMPVDENVTGIFGGREIIYTDTGIMLLNRAPAQQDQLLISGIRKWKALAETACKGQYKKDLVPSEILVKREEFSFPYSSLSIPMEIYIRFSYPNYRNRIPAQHKSQKKVEPNINLLAQPGVLYFDDRSTDLFFDNAIEHLATHKMLTHFKQRVKWCNENPPYWERTDLRLEIVTRFPMLRTKLNEASKLLDFDLACFAKDPTMQSVAITNTHIDKDQGKASFELLAQQKNRSCNAETYCKNYENCNLVVNCGRTCTALGFRVVKEIKELASQKATLSISVDSGLNISIVSDIKHLGDFNYQYPYDEYEKMIVPFQPEKSSVAEGYWADLKLTGGLEFSKSYVIKNLKKHDAKIRHHLISDKIAEHLQLAKAKEQKL
jgi:hypothetical protein